MGGDKGVHTFPKGVSLKVSVIAWSYLPTPPLGQDMTQGQILSGV